MKKIYFILLLAWLPLTSIASEQKSAPSDSKLNINESIIKVKTDKGVGTGFYIHRNIVATNFHVIDGARKIVLLPDDKNGIEVDWIIDYDRTTDIALMYTAKKGKSLHLNTENLTPGMNLISIGYPLGGQRYSLPCIFIGWENFDDIQYLQVHAIIIPGMSGGPILDLQGNVVGLNRIGNYNPYSQKLASVASIYIKNILIKSLKKDFSQYIEVKNFWKETKEHLKTEKRNGQIFIKDSD